MSAILGRAVSRLYCLTGEWAEGDHQQAMAWRMGTSRY